MKDKAGGNGYRVDTADGCFICSVQTSDDGKARPKDKWEYSFSGRPVLLSELKDIVTKASQEK